MTRRPAVAPSHHPSLSSVTTGVGRFTPPLPLHQRHVEAEPLRRVQHQLMDGPPLFGVVALRAVVLEDDPEPVLLQPAAGLVDVLDLPYQRPDLARTLLRQLRAEAALPVDGGDQLDRAVEVRGR